MTPRTVTFRNGCEGPLFTRSCGELELGELVQEGPVIGHAPAFHAHGEIPHRLPHPDAERLAKDLVDLWQEECAARFGKDVAAQQIADAVPLDQFIDAPTSSPCDRRRQSAARVCPSIGRSARETLVAELWRGRAMRRGPGKTLRQPDEEHVLHAFIRCGNNVRSDREQPFQVSLQFLAAYASSGSAFGTATISIAVSAAGAALPARQVSTKARRTAFSECRMTRAPHKEVCFKA